MTHISSYLTLKTCYVSTNRVKDRFSGLVNVPPTPFGQRENPSSECDVLTGGTGEGFLCHSRSWLELSRLHDGQRWVHSLCSSTRSSSEAGTEDVGGVVHVTVSIVKGRKNHNAVQLQTAERTVQREVVPNGFVTEDKTFAIGGLENGVCKQQLLPGDISCHCPDFGEWAGRNAQLGDPKRRQTGEGVRNAAHTRQSCRRASLLCRDCHWLRDNIRSPWLSTEAGSPLRFFDCVCWLFQLLQSTLVNFGLPM